MEKKTKGEEGKEREEKDEVVLRRLLPW